MQGSFGGGPGRPIWVSREFVTVYDLSFFVSRSRQGVSFLNSYNPATFEKLGNFTYTGEGWGLTHDDTRIISSDGTEFITFRDAQFVAQGKIAVTDQGKPIRNLNELNYLPPNSKFNLHSSSAILANIWQTTKIARADLETGWINGYMDCRQLLQLEQQQSQTGRVDVLNGIATDDQGRLWVTGKWWSHFYVLEPEDAAGTTSTSTLSIRTTTDSTVTTSKVGAAVPLLSGSRMRLVVVFANVMCLLLLYGLHTQ